MKFVPRAAAASFAIYFTFASAGNATIILQAASGHPHLSSAAAQWNSEWSASNIAVIDGRTVQTLINSSTPNPNSRTWDVPIPITATNVNWSAVAFALPDATVVTNRICAFDNLGLFAGCGATVAANGAASSTIAVPIDGTAYSQSFLNPVAGGSHSAATLTHIKAF